jgi:hypothetical protein
MGLVGLMVHLHNQICVDTCASRKCRDLGALRQGLGEAGCAAGATLEAIFFQGLLSNGLQC